MKNLFFLFVSITLFATIGCKGVDKELVSKMQADAVKLDSLSAPLGDLGKKVENLYNLVNAAPESVKNSGDAQYGELLTTSSAMNQKVQATTAEYNDIVSKLKALVADYSAGKIKKEDVQKEYETISYAVKGLPDLVRRINEVADQSEAQYAKMSAGWKAEEEGAAK